MSIDSVTAGQANPYSTTKPQARMLDSKIGQQAPWSVESVVNKAVSNSDFHYSNGKRDVFFNKETAGAIYRVQTLDGKPFRPIYDRDGHVSNMPPPSGGKRGLASVFVRQMSEQEMAEVRTRRLDGTLSVTRSGGFDPETGVSHRAVLDQFTDARLPEFKEFIRQQVNDGMDPGTDWQETFFSAKASAEQVAGYESQKAKVGDEYRILADKRGRYLAQYGVDLDKQIALTKLDDGSYAEVSGHPQKQYIEHLVNHNPDLWSSAMEDAVKTGPAKGTVTP